MKREFEENTLFDLRSPVGNDPYNFYGYQNDEGIKRFSSRSSNASTIVLFGRNRAFALVTKRDFLPFHFSL